jgi:hypothetical protein
MSVLVFAGVPCSPAERSAFCSGTRVVVLTWSYSTHYLRHRWAVHSIRVGHWGHATSSASLSSIVDWANWS